MIRIALFQPDIPQNTGTLLRLSACLGVPVDIIRPAGFDISDKALRRAALDYAGNAIVERHDSWAAFEQTRRHSPVPTRLIALTTKAKTAYGNFSFADNDILLLGRETAGLPKDVHASCDVRLRIPMVAGARSLNVAISAAMVVGEALRQTNTFPADPSSD